MARNLLFVWILFLSGCFMQVSLNKMPVQSGETVQIKANLEIPAETAGYKFKLTGAKVGLFNHIMIYVGEALVKYAQTYIETEEDAGTNQVILRITIDDFKISGMIAFLETSFVITENDEIIFEENYLSRGEKYAVVWGLPPVLRKTTDDALSSAFDQFVDDIRSDYIDPRLKKILIRDEWVNE